MRIEDYVGRTVAFAKAEGSGWTLTFTDGTTMTIGGCGCCGSPWIDELEAQTEEWDPAAAPPML